MDNVNIHIVYLKIIQKFNKFSQLYKICNIFLEMSKNPYSYLKNNYAVHATDCHVINWLGGGVEIKEMNTGGIVLYSIAQEMIKSNTVVLIESEIEGFGYRSIHSIFEDEVVEQSAGFLYSIETKEGTLLKFWDEKVYKEYLERNL